MQTTLTAPAGASWLTAALCALFMIVQSVGCKPEFTDNTCKTDQDCFASEICGPAGACIIAPQVVTPTISSFAAAPTALVSGETLTLSWSLRDTTSATITSDQGFSYTIPAAGLAQGMTTLTPEQTATYTLTAVNGELSVTRTVMVEVTQPELPAITSFAVDPTMVDAGGMVTLSWETAGALSGQITGGAQPYNIPDNELAAGATRVAVNQPTTFTLTVVNPAGMDDASVSVGVNGQAPAITAFAATPSAVVAGDAVVLSWQTAGAASITITDAAANSLDLTGQAPGAGQITINPAASNTYTLTAVNPFGEAPRSVDVTVVPKLTIDTFTAAPDSITAGESITLTWTLTGTPTSVEIRDAQGRSVPLGGAALSGGAVMAAPSQTTTYTITARDAQQEATATADVTVIPLPPTITQFITDQPRISAGGAANLSWRTTGATSIVLADAQGNMIDVTGKNPSIDAIAVSPTQTTTYTLRALNAGGMVSADVTVNVGGEVTINSFAASPMGALVGDAVTLAWDISDAATISIVGSDGTTLDVTGKSLTQDTISVTPALGMTTYTLTATGFAGPATATTTVTISSGVAITAFTASPNPVAVGQPTTLSWTTSGATGLTLTATTAGNTTSIDLTGKNIASDTIAVSPTAATTYTLAATGALNSMTSATVDVTVFTPAGITSFTADDTTTISGEAVTLSWQTTGATGLTIVDQLGGQVTIPAGADLASDSIVVRPQVTTTYTLLVTGAQSSDAMASVTITVTPATLLITELLVDVPGADDGQQWVELYNPGDTFVDLANYSLGHGGADYLTTRVQLAGVLAPRGCAVIGGPTSDAANGAPTFFQAVPFAPALQSGAATASGVALFAATAATLTAASVPMDAILYDGPNTAGLPGEDGQPKTVISPTPGEGASIERVSPASDLFRVSAAPTPGRCATVAQVQGTTRAPNEASGTLRFTGFAFDPMLMTAALGAQTLTCAVTGPGAYECPLAAPGLGVTGAQALTITQTHEYTADASDAAVRTPLATSRVTTRPAAFFWEGRLEDMSGDLFCGHFQPGASTATAGQPISVFGEIYINGVTNMGGGTLPAGYIVEGGYFARGQTPYLLFGQAWTAATLSSTFGGMFNSNVIYSAPLTSATAQQAEAALRYSPDGISYYYCDLSTQGGSDNGWTTNGGALIEWTP